MKHLIRAFREIWLDKQDGLITYYSLWLGLKNHERFRACVEMKHDPFESYGINGVDTDTQRIFKTMLRNHLYVLEIMNDSGQTQLHIDAIMAVTYERRRFGPSFAKGLNLGPSMEFVKRIPGTHRWKLIVRE